MKTSATSHDTVSLSRTPIYRVDHPLLGRFQIDVDFATGATAEIDLTAGVIRLRAPTGVLVRTPAQLPNYRVTEATYDLAKHDVRVDSRPELGRFGERIVAGVLKDTVFRDLGAGDNSTLFKGLKVTKNGVQLHSSSLVEVAVAPDVAIAFTLHTDDLELRFSKPIRVIFAKVFGESQINALRWNFAEGVLIPEVAGEVALWRRVVQGVVPRLAKVWYQDNVPAELLAPGYNPTQDPDFAAHVNTLLQQLAGLDVANGAAGPDTPEVAARILWDRGDTITLAKDGDKATFVSENGVYVDVGDGSAWTRDLRIRRVRWRDADSRVDVQATYKLGQALKDSVEPLIRTQIVKPLTQVFEDVPRDDKGQFVVHVEGVRIFIPDAAASVTFDGTRLSMAFEPPVRLRAAPFIKFRASHALHVLGSGEVKVDLEADSLLGRLFVRRARRKVSEALTQLALQHLPPAAQVPGYDFLTDPDQTSTLAAMMGATSTPETTTASVAAQPEATQRLGSASSPGQVLADARVPAAQNIGPETDTAGPSNALEPAVGFEKAEEKPTP